MKAKTKEELAEDLENCFARYEVIMKNGIYDPNWADGVNLNLVRNHIINRKMQIENCCLKDDYPDIYYRKTPEVIDDEYMARPEEIRIQAKEALKSYNSFFYLDELKSARYYLNSKELIETGIQRSLNCIDVLQKAIEEDDLVSMRRISAHPEAVIKDMEQSFRNLCEFNMEEEKQISLFEIMM